MGTKTCPLATLQVILKGRASSRVPWSWMMTLLNLHCQSCPLRPSPKVVSRTPTSIHHLIQISGQSLPENPIQGKVEPEDVRILGGGFFRGAVCDKEGRFLTRSILKAGFFLSLETPSIFICRQERASWEWEERKIPDGQKNPGKKWGPNHRRRLTHYKREGVPMMRLREKERMSVNVGDHPLRGRGTQGKLEAWRSWRTLEIDPQATAGRVTWQNTAELLSSDEGWWKVRSPGI